MLGRGKETTDIGQQLAVTAIREILGLLTFAWRMVLPPFEVETTGNLLDLYCMIVLLASFPSPGNKTLCIFGVLLLSCPAMQF